MDYTVFTILCFFVHFFTSTLYDSHYYYYTSGFPPLFLFPTIPHTHNTRLDEIHALRRSSFNDLERAKLHY